MIVSSLTWVGDRASRLEQYPKDDPVIERYCKSQTRSRGRQMMPTPQQFRSIFLVSERCSPFLAEHRHSRCQTWLSVDSHWSIWLRYSIWRTVYPLYRRYEWLCAAILSFWCLMATSAGCLGSVSVELQGRIVDYYEYMPHSNNYTKCHFTSQCINSKKAALS